MFYQGYKRLMTADMIRRELGVGPGSLYMVPMDAKLVKELPVKQKPKKARKPKVKIDPRLRSAVRELRDKWLEHVNAGGRLLPAAEKYAVGRALALPARDNDRLVLPMPTMEGQRRLAA